MKTRDKINSGTQKNTNVSDLSFQEIELEFMVHELKDPLSVIESNMRMLLKRADKYGPYSSGLEKVLNRSLKNSIKASNMLYGLLEIGKSRAGNIVTSECKTDLLIIDTVNETLELLQDYQCIESGDTNCDKIIQEFSDFGVSLKISERVKQSVINQDLIKIRQILGNLIKNALHYRNKIVNIDSDIVDDHLLIHVIDDGPGIEPEHYDLIFKRYVQIKGCDSELKRNKHGLGLATARIMARYLGGDIIIRKPKECGANFEISLPLKFNEQ